MRIINRILKGILPTKIVKLILDIKSFIRSVNVIEQNQINFFNSQHEEFNLGDKQRLRNREFKIYSQNGEDGILAHIFSKIGVKNKIFVEFGIESGRECNTANLSINFGWKGLLIEGDREYFFNAREYYNGVAPQVKLANNFVTADNINKIFEENGVVGDIDLLSLDIDGNDYWVWKAIDKINPRVVVIEYNASFGDDKSITIEYDEDFERFRKHKSGLYHGASLKALNNLAKEKGYVLVGCDSSGCNAFFVKEEIAKKKMKKLSVKEAYYGHSRRLARHNTNKQFDKIKHMKFKEV